MRGRQSAGLRSKPAVGLALVLAVTLAGCASRQTTTAQVDQTTVSAVPGKPNPPGPVTELPVPTSGPLTLESAVQRAVRWHPAVGEAVAKLRQQMEDVNVARAGYMPRVSWGIDSGYNSQVDDRY